MGNFRKELVKGFRNQLLNNKLSDDDVIDNLINSNMCPHQLGMDGGFNPDYCTSDCDSCWNGAYIQNN